MANLLWHPGAFAERNPQSARIIGRDLALEDEANEQLFATAGCANDSAIAYGSDCGPAPCSSMSCGEDFDTACKRGTADDDEEGGFEDTFPEVDAALDNARALAAAVRDIQADPEVEDLSGAFAQAMQLAGAGKLSALYAPKVPAKKLPDGNPAPARCPICGACACPGCGKTCCCCDSDAE